MSRRLSLPSSSRGFFRYASVFVNHLELTCDYV
ncbi:hypothetical protein M6B38_156290 [Iris pallida]|uniref:Uncharacterized protein n=1 Tax=Iris pallida TaxID=29817 RepID=A0AAX6F4P3_IRIPA|nr:hypothetical protein M6B38_156290 [Iris pallida]